ncbi:hypothetical protein Tco_0080338 [Tanacetum coccineum]
MHRRHHHDSVGGDDDGVRGGMERAMVAGRWLRWGGSHGGGDVYGGGVVVRRLWVMMVDLWRGSGCGIGGSGRGVEMVVALGSGGGAAMAADEDGSVVGWSWWRESDGGSGDEGGDVFVGGVVGIVMSWIGVVAAGEADGGGVRSWPESRQSGARK